MKLFRNVFLFIFSLVVLFAAGGFSIGKMICLDSGDITLSLGEVEDCCEKDLSKNGSFSSKCCDIKNQQFKLNDFSLDKIREIKPPVISSGFTALIKEPVWPISSIKLNCNSPPIQGNQLHLLFRVLII